MTKKLILALSSLLAGTVVLTACNNDVDTSAWLPNYTASGYGGKGGAGGAGGTAGKSTVEAGEGGQAGDAAASAGEGGTE